MKLIPVFVAALAIGIPWLCDACPHPHPKTTESTTSTTTTTTTITPEATTTPPTPEATTTPTTTPEVTTTPTTTTTTPEATTTPTTTPTTPEATTTPTTTPEATTTTPEATTTPTTTPTTPEATTTPTTTESTTTATTAEATTTPTTTEATTTPTTTAPPPFHECMKDSTIKTIIFLVDGSSSMGDGMFQWDNGSLYNQTDGQPVNMSEKWKPYNQWQYVKGLINNFEPVIFSQYYTVIMKQYSSEGYITNGCCPSCAPDMTRILHRNFTSEEWHEASDWTYTNHTNCDTHTYKAIYDTVNEWEDNKAEYNAGADDTALLILITDGLPNPPDEEAYRELAKQALTDSSSVDLFIVYPEGTDIPEDEQPRVDRLLELATPKDRMSFDFAVQTVDSKLRNSIVERVCNNTETRQEFREQRLMQRKLLRGYK